MSFLREPTNLYIDLAEDNEGVNELADRFVEYNLYYIEHYLKAGVDCMYFMDDWGSQDRLLISPKRWREFFKPRYKRWFDEIKAAGMHPWMHSCGHIIDILPALVEAGLDVIQMDQQENMGLESLDKRVGGRVAFWCPVDIQQTMVHGSIEDIVAYVRRMIATLGSHNGGLISMAYSTPEAVGHTPEKIAAMCRAFRSYGVYG
jgi:uroporphyrinogen-III decarboxylase